MSFCLNNASQDLENARRTARVYLYSGTWDPTIQATEAAAGTIFIGVGADPLIKGSLWQKNDDGCTTDWTLKAQGGSGGYTTWPVTKTLYVDGERTDTYTPDGSIVRPFLTIMAAVNQVIANGDNVDITGIYVIKVMPGIYAESVVLENAALKALVFEGDNAAVTIDSGGNDIQSQANNSNLTYLIFNGFRLLGDVMLSGANGANFLGNDFALVDCVQFGNTAMVGAVAYTFIGSNSRHFGNLSLTNVIAASTTSSQGVDGTVTIVTDAMSPMPAGFTNTLYVAQKTVLFSGTISCDADSIFQIRQGTRMGTFGGAFTNNGNFRAINSYVRSNITVSGASAFFFNEGSFFVPAGLSVVMGGTFDNTNSSVQCLYYLAGTPADWAMTAPDDPKTAIDRLATAVAGLLMAPIP